jgi:uncharacterized membrane protein YphA (DoxX/SURF4 family)
MIKLINMLNIVIGIIFLIVGILKIFGNNFQKENYLAYHPVWVYYVTSIVELITGIGFLFKKSRFIAAIIQIVKIILLIVHPWSYTDIWTLFLTIISISILLLLAYLNYPNKKLKEKI